MQLLKFFNAAATQHLRTVFSIACAVAGAFIGYGWALHERVSATEMVLVDEAAIHFFARLDTGATVSSINALDIQVVGGSGAPQRSDVGKRIRFTVENASGENARVEATIDQVRGIRTSDCRELRFHVYLTIVFAGESRLVLVNLNDRSQSKDKLLLGRNWLRHGFVVDVSRT